MKKIIAFFLVLLVFHPVFAQNQSQRKVLVFEQDLSHRKKFAEGKNIGYQGSWHSQIPLTNIEPFLAYSIVWYANNWEAGDQLTVVFTGKHSSIEPVNILQDPHATPATGQYISQLYFTEKNVSDIQLHYAASSGIDRVEVHFFNPGTTATTSSTVPAWGDRSACPCPPPAFLDRLGWCPDGTCPEDITPAFTTVTHLIVHHSAGSNSSSDWAATVRSIYDFHVFVNGWDDIGYNWLIDPNGVVYQGRGDNVRGAHFCGTNAGTMGVCVIGDYTNILPSASAVASLQNLLAWKACDVNIEPNGDAFHASSGLDLLHISGHRDGCATACPGNSFYPTLAAVRTAVQQKLDIECNDLIILPPINLAWSLNQDGNIRLTWEDQADNEDGYRIERSFNTNNNFSVLSNLPANSTEFTDLSASVNSRYYYRVKAVLGDSSSTYSNEVFYDPPSANKQSLQAPSVVVFPNPALEAVTVAIDNEYLGELNIVVVDVLGKIVYQRSKVKKNGQQLHVKLPLTELPGGIYWVQVLAPPFTSSTRIAKH